MFSSIFAQIAVVGGILLGLGAMAWRALAGAKKAGKDEANARQADAAAETQKRVDQAVAGVSGLGDDAVRDELRKSLGAAAGTGDPVQRGPGAGSGH